MQESISKPKINRKIWTNRQRYIEWTLKKMIIL
ncbi:hypothetical protein M5D96_002443 [Drosophila gunungcola]|uniref:Uncharacterized protein n=1 Tax=Drosophila gunungcola TaxID=103775 RepID=A0A9P9YZY6_9MUSC|nr:hypothetical protein M5D96_002443 [Drosophila gunungcola]